MFEFRLLGPLEVVGELGPVHLGGPRQRATLAILLLNANRVVSIDRLADALYAGRAPVTAATQVHRQISELREALGQDARLETRAPGYVIRVASEQLDLKRFERLTEEASRALARGEAETAFELQRDALALWRGPVLSDLDHEPFAQIAIGRLDEILLAPSSRRGTAASGGSPASPTTGRISSSAGTSPPHRTIGTRSRRSSSPSQRPNGCSGRHSNTRSQTKRPGRCGRSPSSQTTGPASKPPASRPSSSRGRS